MPTCFRSCLVAFIASVSVEWSRGQEPVVSEFLAVNDTGLLDGDGVASDWIEIHNPSGSMVDLAGWHLTDTSQDLIRWTFPAGSTIPGGGYEIVFASGSADPPAGEWHTSFSLDGAGEYLALVKPDGVTVASEFAPMFPKQRTDVSFGRDGGGDLMFYTSPTPGAANNSGVLGFVGDTHFSHRRGFYEAPFDVTITATEPGSMIRYTLDGTEPEPSGNGSTYTAPLAISGTSVLRVRAFKTGFLPSNIDTQSYLFLNEVIDQPVNVSGWPNNSYSLGGGGSGTHDYEMDPAVVDAPAYSGIIVDAMKAIPTMSIVTDRDEMFGGSGFYDSNDNEKPASIEVIYPDAPMQSEQVDGGVEGHSHIRMKRSLRLNFRKEVGDASFKTDLFNAMPWNPSGVSSHDVLILRAGNNRAWSRNWSQEKCTFCEDQLSRQTQLATSGYGMRGAFVHLYINGLYWGLYDVVERADEHWTSRYFGGEAEDWYARNHGGSLSGSSSRYNYLKGTLKNKNMANAGNFAELGEYLDLEGFIDYLLIHWLTVTGDWPQNNWYAGNRMESSPFGPTPMRYFAWDSEWSWDLPHPGLPNSPPFDPWVHKDFLSGRTKNQGPDTARIFNSAKDSDDFLLLLADRAFKHLYHEGAMSDTAMQARFAAITGTIRDAVIAESARWGDTLEPRGEPTFTRDAHWENEVVALTALMPGRADKMIAALRAEGYYPSIDPPEFSQRGGDVSLPFTLVLTNPNGGGSVRYTTDGSDPADGGALTYSSPIPITDSVQIRTRVLSGGEWSALDEATFVVPAPPALRITEIMYHPAPPSTAEIAAGFTDQDDFEFIELHNRSSVAIELEGMQFTNGVTMTLPSHLLAAGTRVLIVSNPDAFAMRYGAGADVLGSYGSTRLANGGERLRLESALGVTIADLSYGDRDPWPAAADGDGESLVFIDLDSDTDPDLAENWRASALPGGSAGEADELTLAKWATANAVAVDPFGDSDGDGVVAVVEYAFGLDPQLADRLPSASLDGGSLTVDYQRALFKTDVAISAERSSTLAGDWNGVEGLDVLLSTEREVESHRVSIPSEGVPRQFLRFRVELLP